MDGMGESLSAMRAAKVPVYEFDHCLTSFAKSILFSIYPHPLKLLNP